ncbi:MAG: hypothetical protein ABR954_09465 [Dehalococcoidales bacterium]
MTIDTIYSDGLITITQDNVVFHNYYFPGVSKVVPISNIEQIVGNKPSVFNGKWRLWGSGRYDIWFPMDMKRPSRDRIFHAKLKNTDYQIGFTVKDSARVENIFRQMHLMV